MGACQRTSSPAQDHSDPRIGVYDSRSVAVAFAGSERHEQQIRPLSAEALKAAQELRHLQAFGTEPVEDILELYPEDIEALKRERQLDALVSQWDKKGLAMYNGAARVDVTEALVEIPGPNDRQRQSALDVRKHPPVSHWKLKYLDRN